MHKPYELRFGSRENYLFAFVKGEEDSLDISVAFWREIVSEVRQRNYTKVLVVEDFKTVINTIDMYMLGHQMGLMGCTNLNIAFVDLNPDHFDLNKFGETVAINRGISGRIFPTEKEAWLLDK